MCNGDWEHTYGITIGNIDNPGWMLDVELSDTPLYGISVKQTDINFHHETEWVFYKVENGKFMARGGPKMLGKMISLFLDWAESNTPLDQH